MTSDQQLAMISQVLQGGFGGIAPMPPTHARGNEMYKAVADPGSMLEQLRGFAGPYVGSTFLGMQNPVNLPRVAPGQGIGEAFYANRVTSRQWELTQQQALYDMSTGLGNDLGKIGGTMHLPQMLGMSTHAFQRMVNKGASTPLAMQAAGMIANMPAMQELMGGNALAPYQTMFANRSMFGSVSGMPTHPMDRSGQEQIRQVGADIGRSLSLAIRGTPNGGMGVLPNYAYTRGFADEQIANVAVEAQAGGRWGDVGGRLRSHGRGSAAYTEEISRVTQDIGAANKMFESLGDLMGSRDMDQLMSTMGELTHGQWAKLDWNALNGQLREMAATAQVLNVSKGEMMRTVQTMQGTIQGSIGVTANQVAMGINGGGYGGLAVGVDMARQVYSIAANNNVSSPFEINRIATQQAGLMGVGMQSSAGRTSQLMEYMFQTGTLDKATYDDYNDRMQYGKRSEKTSVAEELFARSFGGRRVIDDPMYMAMIREKTQPESAVKVLNAIRTGQRYELDERMTTASRKRVQATTDTQRSALGMRYAEDPEIVAAAQSESVLRYLNEMNVKPDDALKLSNPDVYASKMEQYNAAVSGTSEFERLSKTGTTKAEGYQHAIRMLQTEPGMARFARRALGQAEYAGIILNSKAMELKGGPAGEARALLSGLRDISVTDKLSKPQLDEMERIDKLITTDPGAALTQGQGFIDSLPNSMVNSAQREMIEGRVQAARRLGPELATNARAERVMAERLTAGTGSKLGLDTLLVDKAQATLAVELNTLQESVAKGAPGTADARLHAAKLLLSMGDMFGNEVDATGKPVAHSREGILKTIQTGNAEDLTTLLKFQSKVAANGTSIKAEALRAGGLPIDYEEAMRNASEGAGTYKRSGVMATGMAIWNAQMADLDAPLRATFGQLGVAFGKGDVDMQGLFGVTDMSLDMAGGDVELQKDWKRFGKRIGIPQLKEQYNTGAKSISNARDRFDELALNATPEDRQNMLTLRTDANAAFLAGTITSRGSLNRFMADDKYGGAGRVVGDALWQDLKGKQQQSEAMGTVKKNLKAENPLEIAERNKRTADNGADVQRRADRDAEERVAIIGKAGLKDFDRIDLSQLDLASKKAAAVLAPRKSEGLFKEGLRFLSGHAYDVTEGQQKEIANTYGRSFEGLSAEKQEAGKVLATAMRLQKEKQDGDKKGEKLELTGTLTLVNPKTGEEQTVNLSAHGR